MTLRQAAAVSPARHQPPDAAHGICTAASTRLSVPSVLPRQQHSAALNFPTWKKNLSKLKEITSQAGNDLFPTWESAFSSLETARHSLEPSSMPPVSAPTEHSLRIDHCA
jgi:hypothetical protein